MNDQLTNWIKQALPKKYPSLLVDPTKDDLSRLEMMAEQAYPIIKQYSGQVDSSTFKQLLLLYTAHLVNENNNSYSSIKGADLSVNFNDQDKNGSDPYYNQFIEMLKALGLDQDWKISLY